MKLLTINIGSYIHSDILLKLRALGIDFRDVSFYFPTNEAEQKYHNEDFERLFEAETKGGSFDGVFTTNFYPIIARLCHERGIKYLAWSYDSPMNLPNTEEMAHPTNYIFLFDRAEWKKYRDAGFGAFYHLPLAVNCDRLDRYAENPQFATDVSLMGQLYESTLPMLKSGMTPYQNGYVDALVQAQMQVYGSWFVEEALSQELIDSINRHYREIMPNALQVNRAQLAYSVAQQITHIERIALLRLLRQAGLRVDLYTYELSEQEKKLLNEICVHPPVSYAEEMPQLFKSSRINLNPTLKDIGSGISLRALDIVGSGGFLLTNWQPEIAEHFADGEEVVMYTGIEDAVEKARYYLRHDDARRQIAQRGYLRARQDFRYEDRITEMLRVAEMSL